MYTLTQISYVKNITALCVFESKLEYSETMRYGRPSVRMSLAEACLVRMAQQYAVVTLSLK